MPSKLQATPALDTAYSVLGVYSTVYLFDVFLVAGTLVLLATYIWSRALGHVDTFCDISDLGVNLPERIVFRLDLSILGGLLFFTSFIIRDITKYKVPDADSKLPDAGCALQAISGFGMIGVAACAENEIGALHVIFAVLAFGGAAIAQILYGICLWKEDTSRIAYARTLFIVRMVIVGLFFVSLLVWGLGSLGVIPEPAEHIGEWLMFVFLVLFFFTFRFDITRFDIATLAADDGEADLMKELEALAADGAGSEGGAEQCVCVTHA